MNKYSDEQIINTIKYYYYFIQCISETTEIRKKITDNEIIISACYNNVGDYIPLGAPEILISELLMERFIFNNRNNRIAKLINN